MFAVPNYRVRNSGQFVRGSRFAWVLFAVIGVLQLIPGGLFDSRPPVQQANPSVHASADHLASNGIKPSQCDVVIQDRIGNNDPWLVDLTQIQLVWRRPEIEGARWISHNTGAHLHAPCDLVELAVRLQI